MRYRKRPVIVDAVRWIGDNLSEVTAFVGKRPGIDRGWLPAPQARQRVGSGPHLGRRRRVLDALPDRPLGYQGHRR